MTDRELLELAAKAAGIEYGQKQSAPLTPALYIGPGKGWWNPLHDKDDAEALRQALGLPHGTSREIVRAAAAIGKATP